MLCWQVPENSDLTEVCNLLLLSQSLSLALALHSAFLFLCCYCGLTEKRWNISFMGTMKPGSSCVLLQVQDIGRRVCPSWKPEETQQQGARACQATHLESPG